MVSTRKSLLLVGMALSVTLLVCSCDNTKNAPKEINLKLDLPEGYYIMWRQTEELVLKKKHWAGGGGKCKAVLEFSLNCTEVDEEGVMTLEQTWLMTTMKGKRGIDKYEYDSNRGGFVPPEARQYAALVGKTVTIKVKPDGTILDIQPPEAIADAILAAVKLPRDVREEPEYLEMLRQRVIEGIAESGENVLMGALREYPGKVCALGESFTIKERGFATRPSRAKTTLTYKGVKKGKGLFDAAATLMAGSSWLDSMSASFMSPSSSVEAKAQGKVHIDPETGLYKYAKIRSEATITAQTQLLGQAEFTNKKTYIAKITTTVETLQESF